MKILSIQQTIKKIGDNENYFTNTLIFIFLILGLIGIINHAMWRDEINVWLMTRDSLSIPELFQNMKYEGHPALWYICLYLLNQITHDPVIMQFFHLFLGVASAYIFFRFSSFTKLQKSLFCFGYLPFYEYLLVSRNYAIGVLLIFGFCALFPKRKTSYIALSIILFLLANANAYCLLIAIALGATLIFEYIIAPTTVSKLDIVLSLSIFILGIFFSLLLLIPPQDSVLAGGTSGWVLQFDFIRLITSLTRIWSGYVVIIVPNDKNAIEMSIFALVSVGFFIFTALFLSRKPVALFLYLFGTLEILTFTYIKFLGGPRHFGHLYILLIASLWIASYYPKKNFPEDLSANKLFVQFQQAIKKLILFAEAHQKTFFMLLLYAQLLSGVVAFGRDLLIPFSASRETARFIQQQQLDRLLTVGSTDYAISPICGYLNKKVYYPEIKSMGSFVLFTKQRKDVDNQEVLTQTGSLFNQENNKILLILNRELNNELIAKNPLLQISGVSKFTNSFMSDEKYYLYLVSQIGNDRRREAPPILKTLQTY